MTKTFNSLFTKLITVFMSIIAVTLVATSCGGDNSAEEKVDITISKTEIELTEGESFQLTVTVKPDDADNKKIEWTSANTDIATVNDGLVAAVKVGETIITAKTNEKTVSCKVKVKAKSEGQSDNSSTDSSTDNSSKY